MMEPESGNPAAAMQSTTLAQKADIIAGLAMFPALTVMVFLRRKIGYRFLSPTKLLAMTAILWIVGGLSTLAEGQSAPSSAGAVAPFIIFALIMLITGMVERYLRWRDIKRGVPWHTYSRGVSWLSTVLPLSDSNIKRYADPLIVAIVGVLVMIVFRFLGYYILFSACCLFIFEAWDYEQSLNRMLDQLDNLVDSEVVSENVAYYSKDQPEQRPLEETAGIPTGIAPDIEAQIQKRRSRKPGAGNRKWCRDTRRRRSRGHLRCREASTRRSTRHKARTRCRRRAASYAGSRRRTIWQACKTVRNVSGLSFEARRAQEGEGEQSMLALVFVPEIQ